MRSSLFAAAVILAVAPAGAQDGSLDRRLAEMARPWLAAENPQGDAARIDATVACVMDVLEALPDDVKTAMLALDDFEDALDAAVRHDGSLERPLEACF